MRGGGCYRASSSFVGQASSNVAVTTRSNTTLSTLLLSVTLKEMVVFSRHVLSRRCSGAHCSELSPAESELTRSLTLRASGSRNVCYNNLNRQSFQVSPNAIIHMPAVTFPLEIKETILELLAEDDKGHLALKTCSLVCRAFLPISRKHIFESIVLDQRSPTTTYAFECLLRETPEIADYIRKLDYNIPSADLISSSFQESLKRISRLESLSVRHINWEELDWSDNPIRPTLLHLLHLPTLTYFKIIGNNDFVISDLIPCVNLKYLDIGVHTTLIADNTFNSLAALPKHSIRLREFVRAGTNKNSCSRNSATILKLCSARRPDGQAIIDFGSLSKITVTLDDPIEGEALQELFSRCHALTNAHISCKR